MEKIKLKQQGWYGKTWTVEGRKRLNNVVNTTVCIRIYRCWGLMLWCAIAGDVNVFFISMVLSIGCQYFCYSWRPTAPSRHETSLKFPVTHRNGLSMFFNEGQLWCLRYSPWRPCGRWPRLLRLLTSHTTLSQSRPCSSAQLTSALKPNEPLLGCWKSTTARAERRHGWIPTCRIEQV